MKGLVIQLLNDLSASSEEDLEKNPAHGFPDEFF